MFPEGASLACAYVRIGIVPGGRIGGDHGSDGRRIRFAAVFLPGRPGQGRGRERRRGTDPA